MQFKRGIYIALFVLLGILLQFAVHAVLEIWYIGLLLSDFERYGLGMSWDDWVLLIHNVLTMIFFVGGVWLGYRQGVYWWHKIYVQKIRWSR